MKALRTLALAYLYYPHLWMMRLIGPYGAVVVARALAWLHWLGTFFGVDRATKKALRAAASQLLVASGPSTILRRHLEVKYQNFCEWHLYPTRRGRRYVERTYQVFDGLEHLESARAQGKGVILLVFHFGLVKMAFPALLAHGYRVQQHVFRGATYAGQVYDWLAIAAMRKLAKMEQSTGLPVIYHRPLTTLVKLMRCLARGEMIAVNADGMRGDDFVAVPFLGGEINLPAGAAELAGRSGAPVVPLFVLLEGLYRHRVVLHEPIYVPGSDRSLVTAALAQYAALLERYVQRYPWAWWTWRRLRVSRGGPGELHYRIQPLATETSIVEDRQVAASAW